MPRIPAFATLSPLFSGVFRRLYALALRRKKTSLVVGILLLTAAVAAGNGGPSAKTTVLATAPVERGDINHEILATGIIKAEEGAVVKTGSRFTGVIAKLYVKLGDTVKQGQLIAELDNREQRFECERLEATLRRLKKQREIIEQTYPLQIDEAKAALAIAEADMQFARSTFERINPLVKTRASAESDLDEAVYRKAMTEQNILLKASILERLEKEYLLNSQKIKDEIDEAEAELQAAKTRLSYSYVLSPMDGQVSEITAQQGETVVAGFQVVNLISVMDAGRLELQIYVDENDIGTVPEKAPVRFSVAALPGMTFEGKVDLVHPAPEIRDNVVYYRAIVKLTPEVALQLRPEMTANCRIVVGRKENVLMVPNSAFKWVGGGQYLFVDKGGSVTPVRPRTGIVGAAMTEIMEPAIEGERVVTEIELPDRLPAGWLPRGDKGENDAKE